MKSKYLLMLLLPALLIASGCNSKKEDDGLPKKEKGEKTEVELKSAADSAIYAYGVLTGNSLISVNEIETLNIDLFIAGLKEAMNDKETNLNRQECNAAIRSFMMAMNIKIAEKNKQEGEEFLEKNKKKKNIEVTASGLQYKIVEEGTGKSPQSTDMVKCHYEGKLLNGRVFDSSYERGEPAQFMLGQVIRGWTEGLQLMKEGGTYIFYIPSHLAYGERAPESVGPNQTLVFKVELLEVTGPAPAPPVQLPQMKRK